MSDSIIPLSLAIILAYAFVRSLDKSAIKVTLTSDGVADSARLPSALESRLTRFAKTNVAAGATVRLRGQMRSDGRISWKFPKSVDPGFAQQLRNYMANEVYF